MTVPAIALTAPEGPPGAPLLVLGPSLGTSTLLWSLVTPALAGRYRVLGWDLPGHGAAPAARAAFTAAELADAVAAAVRGLGGDGPVLYAGVSLGGAVGLELLLRHPGLVSAAAIVASGARLSTPESWHERAALVRAQSTSALIVGSAQRWFAAGSIERQPEISGRLLHALQDADDESYALCCEALAGYDVVAELGRIAVPVLALWGEHDGVAPEPSARQIAEGVADGRVGRIPDAAHLPPAEQPAATAEALLDFFAGRRTEPEPGAQSEPDVDSDTDAEEAG
ncbi:MAG: alpha/beta fold hydrolase [Microbacteriaceae bacterium]